ncbi:MAG: hypothetical protein ABUK01_12805 [Leptospirales bacterium]
MSNYNKGLELETKFMNWAEKNLGYEDLKLRHLVNGQAAVRPYEIDIHGLQRRPAYKALGFIASALFILVFFIIGDEELMTYKLFAYIHELLPKGLIEYIPHIIITSFIMFLILARNYKTVVCIECKNLKTKVKREHVLKFLAVITDIYGGSLQWSKPCLLIFVSVSEYDQDALELAHANDIAYYIKNTSSDNDYSLV